MAYRPLLKVSWHSSSSLVFLPAEWNQKVLVTRDGVREESQSHMSAGFPAWLCASRVPPHILSEAPRDEDVMKTMADRPTGCSSVSNVPEGSQHFCAARSVFTALIRAVRLFYRQTDSFQFCCWYSVNGGNDIMASVRLVLWGQEDELLFLYFLSSPQTEPL